MTRDKAKEVRRNVAMKGPLSRSSNYPRDTVKIVIISDLQFWKILMAAEWKDTDSARAATDSLIQELCRNLGL